jgi:SAM-dependent methyltransferase
MTDKETTSRLFRDQSKAFVLYRPRYPEALYDWLASLIPEGQRGSVVDIACGTGKSTVGLTGIFKHVYGLDLEQTQIFRAKSQFPDIQFLVSGAEQSPIRSGTMDCVTVATAFYWFHMAQALEEFRNMLSSRGHICIYLYYYPVPGNERILEIQRREYDTRWKIHKDPRLSMDEGIGDVLKHSRLFGKVSFDEFPNVVPMNAAQLAGFWSSTSYGALYAKSTFDPKGYWEGLEKEFDGILKGEAVEMDFTVHAWHGQLIA